MLKIGEGLNYLNELGPGKIVKIISTLGVERMNDLTSRIEKKKILDTFKKSDFNKTMKIMKPIDDEDIIYFMKIFKPTEIAHLLNNMSAADVETWNATVSIKNSSKIIQAFGVKNVVYLMNRVGIEKSLESWKILRTGKIISIINEIGVKEAAIMGKYIEVNDLKKWLRKKGIEDIPILVKFIGPENLVNILNVIGIDRCITISNIMTPQEVIVLAMEMKGLTFPKISKKDIREVKKWRKNSVRLKRIDKSKSLSLKSRRK